MRALLDAAATNPIFTATAAPYLILDDDLNIRAVNDAYLRATQRERDELIGQHMFAAFPDNPADVSANGVRNLRASLDRVLREAAPDQMAVQRYDVAPTGSSDFIPKTWSPVNSPLVDDKGRAVGVLHHVEDLTGVLAGEVGQNTDVRAVAVAAARYRHAHDVLTEANSRLTDALIAVGTSRGPSSYASTVQRRRRLWQLLAARAGEDSWPGWSASLCLLAVQAFHTVSGAAITVRTRDRSTLLAASDVVTGEMERLGAVMGEGPTHAALLGDVPVHIADISSDDALWPEYAVAARDAEIVGLSSFPLLLGGDAMGAFTVYRRRRERGPDHAEWIDTAIAADLAVSTLLADEASTERLLQTDLPIRNVAVAAGMVGSRFDISFDEAVSRLRIRASRIKVPVNDVAADVIWRWRGR